LTLYYEDQGFSSRISRRSRSAFTATTRSVLLNTESNTQIDAETQVDLQVGYAFNSGAYKGLSVLLQVNNVTDAPAVQTRGPEVGGNALGLLPWKTENFGRSMMVGATYKF
jgi:iron complex outermembrane receptor protein